MDSRAEAGSIAFWRPTDLPYIEILVAHHTTHRFCVYHETYTVCLVTARGGEWTYRGRTYVSEEGDVMLLEPGEVHVTTKLLGEWVSFRVVFVDPLEIERAAAEMGELPLRPHLTPNVADD